MSGRRSSQPTAPRTSWPRLPATVPQAPVKSAKRILKLQGRLPQSRQWWHIWLKVCLPRRRKKVWWLLPLSTNKRRTLKAGINTPWPGWPLQTLEGVKRGNAEDESVNSVTVERYAEARKYNAREPTGSAPGQTRYPRTGTRHFQDRPYVGLLGHPPASFLHIAKVELYLIWPEDICSCFLRILQVILELRLKMSSLRQKNFARSLSVTTSLFELEPQACTLQGSKGCDERNQHILLISSRSVFFEANEQKCDHGTATSP